VAWAVTVEKDLPEGTTASHLEDFLASDSLLRKAAEARDDAYMQLQKGDGVITDVVPA